MIKSKTRLRVARVAAGAVFAAGASLTAAGAASGRGHRAKPTPAQAGTTVSVGGLLGGIIGGGDERW